MAAKETKGAVIEIGTNSVKFFLGKIIGKNRIETLRHQRQITRLGEGLEEKGVLNNEAMARTGKAIGDYWQIAHSEGVNDILIFGTHALRVSNNAPQFLEMIKSETGREAQVLTGQKEAFMTRRGILLNQADIGETESLIIDIGGGSTEIISGIRSRSLPIGCVSMTESLMMEDSPDNNSLIRVNSRIRDILLNELRFINPGRHRYCIGVGGTALAAVALAAHVDGFQPDLLQEARVTSQQIRKVMQQLSSKTSQERREILKFDPDRADVIIGGLLILNAFFNYAGVENFRVSIFNIIHGMFYEYYLKKFAS